MMVFALARRHSVVIDLSVLEQIVTSSFTSLGDLTNLDQTLQGSDFMDLPTGMAGRLIAAAGLGLPQSTSTGALARLIARRQRPDGRWSPGDSVRPPQSFSAFTTTANALRTLQLFLPETMGREQRLRVHRARRWLSRTRPVDTEDRAYQLFGLHWAGNGPQEIRRRRDALAAEQRPDGGWGQIPDRPSDAYATGEALSALNQAGRMSISDPIYQKGLKFLLNTQKPDGTWFVASRLNPPAPLSPPYFETGFPYGHDQFISAMGTSWAASALLLALPQSSASPEPLQFSGAKPKNVPAWVDTVLFGGVGDLTRLIDSGWNVNGPTAMGTTPLMMAAPDAAKVSILLEHGADPNARSNTRYTALMFAASYHATDSVRLLLRSKTDLQPFDHSQPPQHGATPLILSVLSGDVEATEALRAKGAALRTTMLPGGMFPVTPLSVAVSQGDLRMVKALIRAGAPVDEIASVEDGVTSLGLSVFKNDTRMASLLLANGADVNHVDKLGYTPLLWAANVDFGDSSMLSILLRAGANRDLKQHDDLTALQLAVKYKYLNYAQNC
jgi:ankyrin repeat protein